MRLARDCIGNSLETDQSGFKGVAPRSVVAVGVAVAQGVSHETFDSSQASGHGTKVKPATLAGRRPRERSSASGLFTPLTCEEERWSDG